MKHTLLKYFAVAALALTACGGDEDEPGGICYSLSCADNEDVVIADNGRNAVITTRGNESYELTIAGDFANIVFDSYVPWADASHHNNVITVVTTSPKEGEPEAGDINFTVFNDSKSASGKIHLQFCGTTYDDLLAKERAAINFFLNDQIVATTTPSNFAEWQVGDDAPFYWLDADHNVAMRIVSLGNQGVAANDQQVYFRFLRWNLMEYYCAGEMPLPSGNVSDIASAPTSFRFNNFTLESTTQWGQGIQFPLYAGVPLGSTVQLVLPSTYGFRDEISAVIPYLYTITYYPSLI